MVTTIIKKLKLFFLPKHRHIYVVLNGKLKGEWLVQVKKTEEETTFFSLPDKYVRVISTKDLEWGFNNKVLEPVDVLPKSIYNVCVAEYNLKATDDQRNNAFNRREQHTSPDSLDSQ